MKFSRPSIARSIAWITLFAESLVGQDVKEKTVGIQVPGLLKEDGRPNNKGNVIMEVKTEDIGPLLAELRTDPRSMTPAEMVRRTREVNDGVVSFKVSNDSGSRTVKVPEGDWVAFVDSLEDKFEDASLMLAEAELAAAQPDADDVTE